MDRDSRVVNALSFDLEEWFQAEVFSDTIAPDQWGGLTRRSEAQTERVLELLAAQGVQATFFVLGWVAERSPALIRRLAGEGHEIACHGYSHIMITRQSRQEFRDEVTRAKKMLEDIAGQPVRGYRAPTFSVTRDTIWALDLLLESGVSYDSSIFPIRHDRYGIPGSPRFPYIAINRGGKALWEFPGTTIRVAGATLPAAGGGYLRLFPYRWTRAALRVLNRAGHPANIYAHPWEFDAGLPRVRLPLASRLRHYGGIRRNAAKLRRILAEFRCAPMGRVLDRIAGRSANP